MNVTLKSGKNVTLPEKKIGEKYQCVCFNSMKKVTLVIEKTKVVFDSNDRGATLKIAGKCTCGEYHIQNFHRYDDEMEAYIKEQQATHIPSDVYSILHDYADD